MPPTCMHVWLGRRGSVGGYIYIYHIWWRDMGVDGEQGGSSRGGGGKGLGDIVRWLKGRRSAYCWEVQQDAVQH